MTNDVIEVVDAENPQESQPQQQQTPQQNYDAKKYFWALFRHH